MSDFTRAIPGAGCLDLRLTVESGQPRVELVDRVTGQLADAGYNVASTVVRASDGGAPHQRARVFVLATRKGDSPLAAHALSGLASRVDLLDLLAVAS